MDFEVGSNGNWIAIKFGNEFVETAQEFVRERNQDVEVYDGIEGLPLLISDEKKDAELGGMNYPQENAKGEGGNIV